MFEVVSIDWWGRERTEGYAMATIPLLAGRDDESVSFYRDLGDDTWYEWLERYFIGGRKKVLLDEFYANSTEKVFTIFHIMNLYGEPPPYLYIVYCTYNIYATSHLHNISPIRDYIRNFPMFAEANAESIWK